MVVRDDLMFLPESLRELLRFWGILVHSFREKEHSIPDKTESM